MEIIKLFSYKNFRCLTVGHSLKSHWIIKRINFDFLRKQVVTYLSS